MMETMEPARAERLTSPATKPTGQPTDSGATTAAMLIIGNEILSGKVDDENARYLVR